MTWTKFKRQFFLPCLTTDQGSSREARTALQFAELAFMKDMAWRRSSFCMEGGNGEDLFSTKAKVKKTKKIFVHHTAMVGLLFLSQNRLFHFYILYTLCSTEPVLVLALRSWNSKTNNRKQILRSKFKVVSTCLLVRVRRMELIHL